MRKFAIISMLVFCSIWKTYTQQIPIYSQYILSEFLINPAVAGIDGMTTINLSGRKQWIGLQNTPETYSASISTRILKSPFSIKKRKYKAGSKGRVGLGAAFISDKNGAISRTNFKFTYAYHIFIQNYQLSFGLEAYAIQFKIDKSLIEFRNPDHPDIESLLGKSAYVPDAGAGINFSTRKVNVGFSVTNILQSPIKFGDVNIASSELKHIRNYTVYGVYRMEMNNRNWNFEPSFILRGNEKLSFTGDISGRLIYRKEYWAGLSVRTSGELILLLGIKMNRIYIGYSFDYGFNQMSRLSYGSHEIMVAIKLGDSLRRYRWLERY
jgi:type IX secretion system PorP/SprF family membrane protein